MKQHIIHIGFPKAGSTFIQKYAYEHPKIEFNFKDFYDFRFSGNIDLSIKDDKTALKTRILSNEKIASPPFGFQNVGVVYKELDIKGVQKKLALTLKELFPSAKILIVTRGPKEILPSSYFEYIIKTGTKSYADFLDDFGAVLVELFDYDYILQLYSEIFGKENIIVLPFEMLKEQPSNFLHTLEQEFSIPHFDFKIKKINASLPIQTIPTLIKISTVINKMITWLPKNIQLKTAYTYAFFLHFVKEHLLVRLKNKSKNEVLEDKGAVQKLLPIFHANTQNICKEKHITMYAHLYK